MAKGPYLPNIQELISAGINPANGLPIKLGSNPDTLKDDIRKVLRVIDLQDAVNRYKWYNLPDGLDGELIERILYYRGQGMFFYSETDTTFYFLPYALQGGIDCYGRYKEVTPVVFGGTASSSKDKQQLFMNGLIKRVPQYSIKLDEIDYEEDFVGKCVLLHDYTKQISQTIIPRQSLNEAIINVEAECVPYMRTAMILATGIKGMGVSDADQQDQVRIASKEIEHAALTGQGWIPIVRSIDIQELTDAPNMRGADYMQAMESIDNFRLGTYGITNGGLFQKKAHMLETEQAMAGGSTGIVYQDGLRLRQKFCDIVNSIWGLGIWCDASESVMGGDVNGDGVGYDVEDPSTSGGEFEKGETENE